MVQYGADHTDPAFQRGQIPPAWSQVIAEDMEKQKNTPVEPFSHSYKKKKRGWMDPTKNADELLDKHLSETGKKCKIDMTGHVNDARKLYEKKIMDEIQSFIGDKEVEEDKFPNLYALSKK